MSLLGLGTVILPSFQTAEEQNVLNYLTLKVEA